MKILCAILLLMTGTITACDSNFTQGSAHIMNVKIISIKKCSATPPTISFVKEVAGELGIAVTLEHIIVTTVEDAIEHKHIGSPTIQINGRDIDPDAREINQFGIT
jgi:hypothetical protein